MKYLCPECRGVLNPRRSIVLIGHRERRRGLFLFEPQEGSYEYTVTSGLELRSGERWEFSCPICHTDLTTPTSDRLAQLRMEDDGAKFQVVFSKIATERATFTLTKRGIEAFAQGAKSYLEFASEGTPLPAPPERWR